MDKIMYRLHLNAARHCGKESSCTGKVRYGSELSAQDAAVRLNESPKCDHKVEHYPCPFCKGWHIGRVMSIAELLELSGRFL